MSFNGSGTFLINSTGQPVVANTVISATVFNALTADLASGLTNCITKDGQSTPTANIPMGSNKITGLANGTLINDAATLGQVQTTAAKLITSVSGVDTVTGIMSPTLTAYAAGQLFYFVAAGANTGAVTLNIDGLGAKAVTRDGASPLAAGDIHSGEMVVVIYDGTRFQMINAANSFGNTTINGTLTVTGNTALQANVSITSALSVGGTFAVTGAAALGSTLAVTGKSDLPTVSTASVNAAVAAITTATVTNLTATSASVASVNAGVALLTTATVTDLTASSASIASANIGNLQFTAASIASINAGVAVVTNLTATSASIASANVGTAVVTTGTVTNLTSTSASIASANAAVALVTTGTVTNLTSTAASIASVNLGTAVVTTLTATGASIASANAGVANVSDLRVVGASVTSANVGTAVVTGLTVTNASIASLNAGTATITTGNLTFSSTGQRITGDFNNATISNRLLFQTSGVNNSSNVQTLPNGTSTTAGFLAFANSDPTNTNFAQIVAIGLETRVNSGITGTGTYAPMTFYTGGSERMRLTTDGNLGLGTTSPGARFEVSSASNQSALFKTSATGSYGAVQIFNTNTNGEASIGFRDNSDSDATSWVVGKSVGATDALGFYYGSTRMVIDSSGNVGIGTTSPSFKFEVQQGSSGATPSLRQTPQIVLKGYGGSSSYHSGIGFSMFEHTNGYWGSGILEIDDSGSYGAAMAFYTSTGSATPTPSERMRITSGGEVYIAGTTDQGAYNLQCNGTGVWGAGAYVNGSDAQLKDNIQSLDSGLDVVKAMRPVTFQYKPEYSKDQSVQPGFIAQELKEAMAGKPYLDGVVQEGTNHLNVAYQNIIPILVKAIQELEAKVAALEAK